MATDDSHRRGPAQVSCSPAPGGGPTGRGRPVTYAERARFYDIEYDETTDRNFLRSLVTDEIGSVLEIPCGAGRNAEWLSRIGRFVTLADLEPRMVERTEKRLRALGAGPRIRTVVADMRHLALGQKFDLILVPREAFQLLTDRRDALSSVRSFREHLAPSGKLFIDLATFAVDRFGEHGLYPSYFDPEKRSGRHIEEWSRDLPEGGTLTRSRVQRVEGDTVCAEYTYEVRADGFLDRWRSEVRLKRYDLGQAIRLLEEGGMKTVRTYRNYRGAPYAPGAGRILLMAEAVAEGCREKTKREQT